jgi:hypothetical protein
MEGRRYVMPSIKPSQRHTKEFNLHFTQAYEASEGNAPNGYHKASKTIEDFDSLRSVTQNIAGNQMTNNVQQQATKDAITQLTA